MSGDEWKEKPECFGKHNTSDKCYKCDDHMRCLGLSMMSVIKKGPDKMPPLPSPTLTAEESFSPVGVPWKSICYYCEDSISGCDDKKTELIPFGADLKIMNSHDGIETLKVSICVNCYQKRIKK